MSIHLANDEVESWAGSVRWSLETLDGDVRQSGEESVVADALADTEVIKLDLANELADTDSQRLVLVTELMAGDGVISRSVHPFTPSKHLELGDPDIRTEVAIEGPELVIQLSSRSLARFVELKLEGAPDTVFSDNYLDLPAGRVVEVRSQAPSGWSAQQVKEMLQVYSLYDSYQVSHT